MCCKNSRIGLIVLLTTFFLGIGITEFFNLSQIPTIEVVEESLLPSSKSISKNCVPADGNLKYEKLGERKVGLALYNKEVTKKNISELKQKKNKSKLEKEMKKVEKFAAREGAHFHTLLYSEQCRVD